MLISDCMVKDITDREIVQYINWCAKVLLSGRFPYRDPNGNPWPKGSWRESMAGQPIAGSYIGAYVGNKADLKARKETHRFMRLC